MSENVKDHIKKVRLALEWESYQITFSLLAPSEDPNLQIIMRGSRDEVEDLFLNKSVKEYDWMPDKYGHTISPWDITIDMPNLCDGKNEKGQYDENHPDTKFSYIYGKRNMYRKEMVWEREP